MQKAADERRTFVAERPESSVPDKKNILVSAGGTATAWHLASLISSVFRSYFNLLVCDINPRFLVAASELAQCYVQAPPIAAPDYKARMLELMAEHKVDIFVPLIDDDVEIFPCDSEELTRLGIRSTGSSQRTARIVGDKRRLSEFLNQHGLITPKTLSLQDVTAEPNRNFFAKSERGFGSQGARLVTAQEASWAITQEPGTIVQELCHAPEVTVEVFNCGQVSTLCRERLETKAGVCTKARIYTDEAMQKLAERLCSLLELPVAFCFQVMRREDGKPVVTDINPRLGAGTALSSACGWSLASAALACWGELPLDPLQFLRPIADEKHVVRIYQERVMD